MLIGYSTSRKAVKVVDPMRYFRNGKRGELHIDHYIKEKVIDVSRSANGTDNDIVFVNLE